MDTNTSLPHPIHRYLRPVLEWLIGLALALVTSPAVLALAVVSWIAFGWPPIRRTSHIGRDNSRFNLFTINSHPPWGTDVRGRRRRLSRWLQRSGAALLPHTWNVVLGHLALVGPAPLHPSEFDDGTPEFSVRPGLTGAWGRQARSVSGEDRA